MWITPEDEPRYEELTATLQTLLARQAPQQNEQPVDPYDLALYLEWLELAREAAPSLRPFIDKSCPFLLRSVSYQQLANDFRWLKQQVSPEGSLTFAAR